MAFWQELKDEVEGYKEKYKNASPRIKNLIHSVPVGIALYLGLYQDYPDRSPKREVEMVQLEPGKVSKDSLRNVLRYKDMIEHVTGGDTHESAMLAAIIYTESKGNPHAGSPSGCMGLAQICRGSGFVEVEDHDKFGGECELFQGKCYPYVSSKKTGGDPIDNRTKPFVSISAGYKIYKTKESIIREGCGQGATEPEQRMMWVLAYNAGEGFVCDAVRKGGEPSWAATYQEIDFEHVKKHLGHLKYFKGKPTKIQGKVQEARRYPYRVLERYPIMKVAFTKTENNS